MEDVLAGDINNQRFSFAEFQAERDPTADGIELLDANQS